MNTSCSSEMQNEVIVNQGVSAQRRLDWSLWRLWVWQSVFLGSVVSLMMMSVRLVFPTYEGMIALGLSFFLAWRVPTVMQNLSPLGRHQNTLRALTLVALATALLGLLLATLQIVLNSPDSWHLFARLVGMWLTPMLFGFAGGAISLLGVALALLVVRLTQQGAWHGPLRPVHLSLLAFPVTFGAAVGSSAAVSLAPEAASLGLPILQAVCCAVLSGLAVMRFQVLKESLARA